MMDRFRVRLNCVDHYQSNLTSLDPPLWGIKSRASQQNAPHVPVIRVFGATETGQKVCAHIRGAFPYLYIEYDGNLERESVDSYIQSLQLSIDHALAVSYRRNNYDGRAIFVAHISLVKGVPFFGYHVGYKYFLKIYMLNPLNMTRLADLLHQGAIMKRAFQPYESHLQYLLQWMCDFNLYGCSYVETTKPFFRSPIPNYLDLDSDVHKWHDRSILPSVVLPEDEFPRQSHCSIEVDICVQDIANRDEIVGRPLHHSFIERFQQLAPEDKLVQSMAGLWKDETKRRKRRMGISDPDSSPFPPEVLVSMSADSRNTEDGGWIHEAEFRHLVTELVADERVKGGQKPVNFDDFVKPQLHESSVQSVFDSVGELFLDKVRARQRVGVTSAQPQFDASQVVVDESTIFEHEDNAVEERVRDAEDEPATSNGNIADKVIGDGLDPKPLPNQLDPASQSSIETPFTPRRKRFLFDDQISPKRRKVDIGNETVNSLTTGNDLTSSQEDRRLSQSYGYHVVKNAYNVDSGHRASQQHSVSRTRATKSISAKPPVTPTMSNVPERSRNKPTESLAKTPISPWMGQSPPGPAANLAKSYYELSSAGPRAFVSGFLPPTSKDISGSMEQECEFDMIYQDAYYSNEKDVPEKSREYGGQEFKLQSTTEPYLPNFDVTGPPAAARSEITAVVLDKPREELYHQKRRWACTLKAWEFQTRPPTWDEVNHWASKAGVEEAANDPELKQLPTKKIKRQNRPDPDLSQIEGPTQKGKHGFKFSQKQESTSVKHETQYMSTMSLEVHVNTRHDLVPDPEHDPISAIFWCLQSDDDSQTRSDDGLRSGILLLDEEGVLAPQVEKSTFAEVAAEQDELDLINHMVDIVRSFDPDILAGYEVHNSSWGYLIERARLKFEYNLPDEFSRMKSQSHGRFGKDADRWGFTHTSTIRVTGRHMINIWRAMRSELNLLQYTMENVAFHLLHRRVPHYTFADLTKWFKSDKPRDLNKVLDYFLSRVKLDMEILEVNELIPRTSEQARLLGVDFFSVFSRGSQFKVESLMFRIAKPESFVLVSPSRKQVGSQNALECLPLVMEPQSAFYPSPLLVLDFQSLYPSVMIAYNFCYSTCLGRIVPWRGTNKLGFKEFKRSPRLLELVKDHINIAPNGMMYVRPEMRKSLLAKMLGEVLETRVMVKSGMKVDKDDRTLQQLLNNRQLALKLLANVTYGYTSASFSGRMPCSEIADSIVQTARETLEKTIAFIHSETKWGAEVVYGDTDSLFVYLKGKTREQAFDIGEDMAKQVTAMNPRPVKLKFEKVYHPCVLLAKKRYVGFKYESRNQKEPEFDAKGIETVRRDGTPAEQKIEEKALKLLFRSADLSQIKAYFQDQCRKIMLGKVSVQDFCFAKEVKLGTYAEKGPPPPGALIATKRMLRDPRSEPQYGERVPYVVMAGAPGARLFERCVEPERLLFDVHAELDSEYYISKNLIPPLERIFNLVGANVRAWFDEMPKIQRVRSLGGVSRGGREMFDGRSRKTMESYMATSFCLVCRTKLPPLNSLPPGTELPLPMCEKCLADISSSLMALQNRLRRARKKKADIDAVCRTCANIAFGEEVRCDSRDCPVFYSRVKANAKLDHVEGVLEPVIQELETKQTRRNLEW